MLEARVQKHLVLSTKKEKDQKVFRTAIAMLYCKQRAKKKRKKKKKRNIIQEKF